MRVENIDTYGEIDPNWMIELVKDPTQNGELRLLFANGEELLIRDVIEVLGPDGVTQRVYRPAELALGLSKAVRLPAEAASYGSVKDLLDGLCAVIKRYTTLTDSQASLLALSAMASWAAEFTEVPICLALDGTPSVERGQLLRLLSCIFRRPLHLADPNFSAVRSLPLELCPTLIVEGCTDLKQLRKILQATSSREAHVIANRRVVNACCPVILCVEESLNTALPCWPAVRITVEPAEQSLPSLDQETQNEIADEFQSQLLMYRIQNGQKIRASSFDLPELSARSRDLARCLGACVGEDHELQALVTKLLSEQESLMPAGAESELGSAIIESMLGLSHVSDKQALGVAEITTAANRVLENRGEQVELKPRAVGDLLRHLGFPTKRLGSERRGFTLLNSVRKRIHELAKARNLLGSAQQSASCSVCGDMFPR